MKPNFALNLTDDSIALLHRTARGWMEVGSTPLDAPDLGEALNYLRRSALGLAPHGIATKLVIPNSQILYLEVEAPGPDAAYRRAQIRKALEGRTPYAVEDLVFDWRGTGATVQVAVIARETLDEAEQFAAQYRFNPVSFVAIPTAGQFAGEPWFGPSALAATLLPEGDKVERDQDAVTIVAREMPRAEPRAEPRPVATTEANPEPRTELPPDPEREAPVVGAVVDAVAADGPTQAAPDLVQNDGVVACADIAEDAASLSPEVTQNSIIEAADPVDVAVDIILDPPLDVPLSKLDAMVADAFPSSAMPFTVADPDAPPPFSSRRSAEPDPKASRGTRNTAPLVADPDQSRPRPKPQPQPAAKAERLEPRLTPMAPAAMPQTETLASAIASSTQEASDTPQARKPLAAPEKTLRKEIAASVTAPSIPISGRKPKAQLNTQAQVAAKPATPPAFSSRKPVQRGKPRYLGLILTGILLLFLAVIAAWSSFYLASASDPAATDTAVAATDVPGVDDEMLADMQDPAELAATDGTQDAAIGDNAAVDAGAAGETAAVVAPVDTTVTPADPAPAAVAQAAGPAPVADAQTTPALAPSSDAQDEIFLASVDPRPVELDALALPKPDAAPDAAPAAQLPPPAFGTVYQFDANGLVKPTAEGIMSPDGVFLIAGPPPRIPPPRPVALIAAAEAAATAVPAAATAAAPAAPVADPALAGFKPRARPAGLAPAPVAAPEDQTSLAIPEGSRLTSLRPHARPASIVALADAARAATAAASLSAPADPSAEPQTEANLSGVGIVVSRKPVARPKDFTKAVEAAVAAAVQPSEEPTPPPAPEPVAEPAAEPAPEPTQQVAAASPEAEPEPDVSGNAPRATQRGTVAKKATFANAINLSQTNLIGVYGTSNNRYAMIRQPNGRYKKVKVGDRVDGGTVAAITQNEVRYQKGGRLISLKMPKG